jgi:leucyl/phenylalanyl-tRNA--protein transferase
MGVAFPPPTSADERGLVFVGGDLETETLLTAYRSGLVPMRHQGELTWWAPDPRSILTVDGLHVPDSLRRSARRFDFTVDTAFEAVVDGCAEGRAEEEQWIDDVIKDAYLTLHRLGWAHSVEAWSRDDPPELVGGLYGVAIGGLFGGESMFHRRTDASKASLVTLVALLREASRSGEDRFIDLQWHHVHYERLGAVEVTRDEYLARLERALELQVPAAFAGTPTS